MGSNLNIPYGRTVSRNVIFEGLSHSKFMGTTIRHTGDGHHITEGFNGISNVTFDEGFELTVVGGRPSSQPGSGLEYYCQAKNMNLGRATLNFNPGTMGVGAEERVLEPTTSSPRESVALRTRQTYDGTAHNQPLNMDMYPVPQAQGNGFGQGWDGPSAPRMISDSNQTLLSMRMYPLAVSQAQLEGNGQRSRQDWGSPPSRQVQMAWIHHDQADTTFAYYGPAPPDVVHQSPQYSWGPYQQWAHVAEPDMRLPAGPVYGNPPHTYNSPPPPPTNHSWNHRPFDRQ